MEELLSNGHHESLPESYILPVDKRPDLIINKAIPVIDLAAHNHEQTAMQILQAGKEYGFFQVVNHGIEEEVIREMLKISKEFFQLPIEEKAVYFSEDANKYPRLHTSTTHVNKLEKKFWRDYFREIAPKYSKVARELGLKILKFIAQGLKLDDNYFNGEVSDTSIVNINFYPQCPDPSLALGLISHCDPNLITVLLPDDQVNGLQVLHHGDWIAVDPIPNAFVINVGHQLEFITNGLLKSVEHRAVTSSTMSRISIATFIYPSSECVIGPAKQLIDEKNGPIFREFELKEFMSIYHGSIGDTANIMDAFKIKALSL
ncbi:2'-deoxymugineic-acid 2'-dioxygenase-like isoform X4 [Dioscorea cayenensis subsp. rotundata]|uniref:2'-deoxymugineic-acid 2'-dioxygenase-like isoform X4 n=1 Tax=Dioscorea cayennensis subsp. rotundata TaxID=55577 RepID=A0AB40C6D8_DIOCR|nr:2'-deoxymugineic-acid 2'-dioxygenase-like isoform X4 [Dioscorea cayenensis subsp. rotundata]